MPTEEERNRPGITEAAPTSTTPTASTTTQVFPYFSVSARHFGNGNVVRPAVAAA
jgi:hypothetical protein